MPLPNSAQHHRRKTSLFLQQEEKQSVRSVLRAENSLYNTNTGLMCIATTRFASANVHTHTLLCFHAAQQHTTPKHVRLNPTELLSFPPPLLHPSCLLQRMAAFRSAAKWVRAAALPRAQGCSAWERTHLPPPHAEPYTNSLHRHN